MKRNTFIAKAAIELTAAYITSRGGLPLSRQEREDMVMLGLESAKELTDELEKKYAYSYGTEVFD